MSENQEQIEFWNGQAATTWVRVQQRLDAMMEDLSSLALDKANPQPGERALDVGCGCGATSLGIAERGAVVRGVDISAPMLALAKERSAGMENVAFSEGDAATQVLSPNHDLIFSRFGVMFFADPVAAFKNLRTGLNIQGRLVFLCWQSPRVNPWVSVAGQAIQPFLPEAETPDPHAPGPFAFADPDRIQDILDDAGFRNIEIEPVTMDLCVGDDVDAALEFQGEVGPLSRVLAELNGAAKENAMNAARQALAPFLTSEGVKLGSATWLVSAGTIEGGHR